jgi:hypothetical protein
MLQPVLLFLLALWCGSLVATRFLAAPPLFAGAREGLIERPQAASLAGLIFQRQLVLSAVLVCGAAAGGGILQRRLWSLHFLLAAALLLLGTEWLWITPEIRALRESLGSRFGSVDAAPRTDPERARFAFLHGLSMLRAMAEMLLSVVGFILVARKGSA